LTDRAAVQWLRGADRAYDEQSSTFRRISDAPYRINREVHNAHCASQFNETTGSFEDSGDLLVSDTHKSQSIQKYAVKKVVTMHLRTREFMPCLDLVTEVTHASWTVNSSRLVESVTKAGWVGGKPFFNAWLTLQK
jgi:hypothetical protein